MSDERLYINPLDWPPYMRRDPLMKAIRFRALVIRHPRDAMAWALAQYWERKLRACQ